MMTNNDAAQEIKLVIDAVMPDHPHRKTIRNVFAAMYCFMHDWHVDGGCHLLSGMSHVLLREVGVQSTLNAGWVDYGHGKFAHSWVEIDDRIFDLAISRPSLHWSDRAQPVVLYGINAETRQAVEGRYGIGGAPYEDETVRIGTGTIASYADAAPEPKWLWRRLQELTRRITGTEKGMRALREAHGDARWVLRGE